MLLIWLLVSSAGHESVSRAASLALFNYLLEHYSDENVEWMRGQADKWVVDLNWFLRARQQGREQQLQQAIYERERERERE